MTTYNQMVERFPTPVTLPMTLAQRFDTILDAYEETGNPVFPRKAVARTPMMLPAYLADPWWLPEPVAVVVEERQPSEVEKFAAARLGDAPHPASLFKFRVSAGHLRCMVAFDAAPQRELPRDENGLPIDLEQMDDRFWYVAYHAESIAITECLKTYRAIVEWNQLPESERTSHRRKVVKFQAQKAKIAAESMRTQAIYSQANPLLGDALRVMGPLVQSGKLHRIATQVANGHELKIRFLGDDNSGTADALERELRHWIGKLAKDIVPTPVKTAKQRVESAVPGSIPTTFEDGRLEPAIIKVRPGAILTLPDPTFALYDPARDLYHTGVGTFEGDLITEQPTPGFDWYLAPVEMAEWAYRLYPADFAAAKEEADVQAREYAVLTAHPTRLQWLEPSQSELFNAEMDSYLGWREPVDDMVYEAAGDPDEWRPVDGQAPEIDAESLAYVTPVTKIDGDGVVKVVTPKMQILMAGAAQYRGCDEYLEEDDTIVEYLTEKVERKRAERTPAELIEFVTPRDREVWTNKPSGGKIVVYVGRKYKFHGGSALAPASDNIPVDVWLKRLAEGVKRGDAAGLELAAIVDHLKAGREVLLAVWPKWQTTELPAWTQAVKTALVTLATK